MNLLIKNSVLLMGLALSFLSSADCTSNRNVASPIMKPDAIYVVHGDGTVTDNQTGLMWQQCAVGLSGSNCATGVAGTYDWQQALSEANSNADNGHSDWRLPNVKELMSLSDFACHTPAINNTIFPNTPTALGGFWTSSPNANSSSDAWRVGNAGNGEMGINKNTALNIRLVRSGY